MNFEKLKILVKNIANNSLVTVQAVYDNYFFECFLKRLAMSKYADLYVLKGGFLLENVLGISNRTTLDIDFLYRKRNMIKSGIEKEFKDIFDIALEDEVAFTLLNIETIKKEQKYDGKRVNVKARLKNITRVFNIDIAANDLVTPGPVNYDYKSLFSLQTISLKTYPNESIVSEKFEAIINLGVNNSRMKDFYDIYSLVRNGDLNQEVLHDALINTFINRKTNISKHYIERQIEKFEQSQLLQERFLQFARKAKYSVNATYEEVIVSFGKVKDAIRYIEPIKLDIREIIFIRHGEDDQTMVGGWSENRLTANGVAQVERLKPTVKTIMVERNPIIIVSDLIRTEETARVLFDNEKVIYEPAFRECNNGSLKNMKVNDFLNLKPIPFFSSLKYHEKYPDGESPQDVYIRVVEGFKELNLRYKDKYIILISHNGVYGILYSLLKGYEWTNKQKYKLDYAELMLLSSDTFAE